MRRLIGAALTVLMIATACGDDSDSVFTTAESTAAPAASFPSGLIEEYMSGCSPDADAEICRCTIEEFEARLSVEEFVRLVDADLETDPVVQDVIRVCLERVEPVPTTAPVATDTTDDGFSSITDIETVTSLTIADLEEWWGSELPAVFGVEYMPVSGFGPYFPSEDDVPDCGGPMPLEVASGNAFYCNINDTVRWDAEGLMAPLFQEFGDFTVALVLAHEWAHAVQARFGFDLVGQPTIVSELQADCLAGAWTGRIDREESDLLRLEPGDLEEGMAGFLLIGDQLGTNPGGANAHGGSFDRLNAFFEGFNLGVTACSTYETDPPLVVFIPLRIGEDPIEGGDLPLADTPELLSGALEVFWDAVYPQLFGEAWSPVSSVIPYLPSTGDLPTCGGLLLESTAYPNNAFYCSPDDYIAWDAEGFFPALYVEFGDFAIGLVLALAWGEAVQHRAGLPTTGVTAELQVDCLAGVWASALVPEDNPTSIVLSAGDLEEAIAAFLQLSAPSPTRASIPAFDRFEAFKDGFLEGTFACGL